MSSTVVIWPILAALSKALLFINAPVEMSSLQTVNQTQEQFIRQYFDKHKELTYFKDNEIRSWASTDIPYLNKILRDEHFDIQLKEDLNEPSNNRFGVVSILDILFTWANKGSKSTLTCPTDKHSYPAIGMDNGFKVYTTMTHEHPLLCIQTTCQDKIWITIADQPLSGFELADRINAIRESPQTADSSYSYALWPMVNLDQNVDTTWLIGLWLGDFSSIKQAKQQTKFKMNECGAHAKSAVALEVLRGCRPIKRPFNILKIDEPYYLWIERPGLSYPIFVSYIDQTNWEDPKNLDL